MPVPASARPGSPPHNARGLKARATDGEGNRSRGLKARATDGEGNRSRGLKARTTDGGLPAPASPAAPARGDKRDAILDAALALFSEHTFDGTPVPLIAERANVGAGTIYRYFPSKEAVGNAVYRRAKRELQRYVVDDAPRRAAVREQFSHWWQSLWRFAGDQPLAFAFLETHHHAPYLDDESRACGMPIGDAARALIRRAQREGVVRRVDADVLMAMVFGAFTGLVKSANDQHIKPSPRMIAETEERIWQMLSA